jgi:hypothetical protein
MDFFEALRSLRADGSLFVEYEGHRYRLVVREGVIRMVVDETEGASSPLPSGEAEALVWRIASQGTKVPTQVSWVVQPVDPLSAAIFVPKESLTA